jgi:hypothetical protein
MRKEIVLLAIAGMNDNTQYIAELVMLLPEEQQEQALIIIAGIPAPILNKTSNVSKDAELTNYNRLTDRVEYTYMRPNEEYLSHDYDSNTAAQEAYDAGTFIAGTKKSTYIKTGTFKRSTSSCYSRDWQ